MMYRSPILVFAAIALLCGCAASKKEQLVAPQSTLAPYGNTGAELLLAVLPLGNESGTTAVDCGILTDKLTAAAEEVRGIRTIPQNTVLKLMASQNITRISGPDEASRLATALGVDGVLIGTVNSYDPYTPALGLSVALFGAPGTPLAGTAGGSPLSLVSSNLDGKNQQVQMDVRNYAIGRVPPNSALAWRRYLASMDLYCEFACHELMREMMRKEWLRLGKSDSAKTQTDGSKTESP